MSDPRYRELARLLVNHSTHLEAGEPVLIESTHIPPSMITALVEEASARGAVAVVDIKDHTLQRSLLKTGSAELVRSRMKLMGEIELFRMEKVKAYIGLRGSHNITEMSDVPGELMSIYEHEWMKPVHLERRVKHTRWVVLRWPNGSMAQLAGMSTQAFEDFYFRVCLCDYAAMEKAVQPLKEMMQRTDRVRIVGPDTDLRFSIKGVGVVPCTGTHNVPDGECFTAPVRDSIEGHIHFNSGSIYRGTPFDDVRLTFEKGKVIQASSSNDEALRAILDTDEGARYVGEFAIAFNPFIEKPMRDILFDEKIRGSLHLALGQCYEETENHNRSSVHWDLVLRQESGGELWFDDTLVRQDGRFVVEALQGLNPENLAGRQPALV
ncbi:MAG: aminopeptidase [Candidatus Eremiobacterota bacterium]